MCACVGDCVLAAGNSIPSVGNLVSSLQNQETPQKPEACHLHVLVFTPSHFLADGCCLLLVLQPYIEELNYPMTRHCSNGDTQVYVNGRELHVKDLAVLSQRGLSQKAGMAYALGFDGVLVDETTGLELKQLGKLAPTCVSWYLFWYLSFKIYIFNSASLTLFRSPVLSELVCVFICFFFAVGATRSNG